MEYKKIYKKHRLALGRRESVNLRNLALKKKKKQQKNLSVNKDRNSEKVDEDTLASKSVVTGLTK